MSLRSTSGSSLSRSGKTSEVSPFVEPIFPFHARFISSNSSATYNPKIYNTVINLIQRHPLSSRIFFFTKSCTKKDFFLSLFSLTWVCLTDLFHKRLS